MATFTASAAVLVCLNGDRLAGEIVAETGDTIVFKATNFGAVCVKRSAVERIEGSAKKVDSAKSGSTAAAGERSSAPAASSWKGRAALTIDRTRSGGHQDSVAFVVNLQREWSRDELRLESTYDLRRDDQRRNADLLKSSTQWVHRLSNRYFATYRVADEWNRSMNYQDRDISYLFLQQELGVGVTFAPTRGPRVRLGVSENFFNVWVRPSDLSRAANNESLFAEVEWKLPWDARLVHRGVLFVSAKRGSFGVEDSIELIRKLSPTVSVSVKHELRENVPDVRLQDYHNLRLLLGYDF